MPTLSVKNLAIGLYGAVMGLAGLALAARAAAPVLPKLVPAPAYFTELWVALAVLAFAALLPLYLYKLLRFPEAVKEEFRNPAQLGFCGALPVGMTLLAGGVAPYWGALAQALWWTSFGLLGALQLWALARWLAGGVELAQVNAGWLIAMVGGVVVPVSGLALGNLEASRFAFGVSATAAPFLVALILYRAVLGPPLPEVLRPSWFILLVPPALLYANGAALLGDTPALEGLYFASLVLALALFYNARHFMRWPFGAPWWAFTFPLDALAYAAARYAQSHPSALWTVVCGVTLALATLAVLIVLLRTLRDPFALLRAPRPVPANA